MERRVDPSDGHLCTFRMFRARYGSEANSVWMAASPAGSPQNKQQQRHPTELQSPEEHVELLTKPPPRWVARWSDAQKAYYYYDEMCISGAAKWDAPDGVEPARYDGGPLGTSHRTDSTWGRELVVSSSAAQLREDGAVTIQKAVRAMLGRAAARQRRRERCLRWLRVSEERRSDGQDGQGGQDGQTRPLTPTRLRKLHSWRRRWEERGERYVDVQAGPQQYRVAVFLPEFSAAGQFDVLYDVAGGRLRLCVLSVSSMRRVFTHALPQGFDDEAWAAKWSPRRQLLTVRGSRPRGDGAGTPLLLHLLDGPAAELLSPPAEMSAAPPVQPAGGGWPLMAVTLAAAVAATAAPSAAAVELMQRQWRAALARRRVAAARTEADEALQMDLVDRAARRLASLRHIREARRVVAEKRAERAAAAAAQVRCDAATALQSTARAMRARREVAGLTASRAAQRRGVTRAEAATTVQFVWRRRRRERRWAAACGLQRVGRGAAARAAAAKTPAGTPKGHVPAAAVVVAAAAAARKTALVVVANAAEAAAAERKRVAAEARRQAEAARLAKQQAADAERRAKEQAAETERQQEVARRAQEQEAALAALRRAEEEAAVAGVASRTLQRAGRGFVTRRGLGRSLAPSVCGVAVSAVAAAAAAAPRCVIAAAVRGYSARRGLRRLRSARVVQRVGRGCCSRAAVAGRRSAEVSAALLLQRAGRGAAARREAGAAASAAAALLQRVGRGCGGRRQVWRVDLSLRRATAARAERRKRQRSAALLRRVGRGAAARSELWLRMLLHSERVAAARCVQGFARVVLAKAERRRRVAAVQSCVAAAALPPTPVLRAEAMDFARKRDVTPSLAAVSEYLQRRYGVSVAGRRQNLSRWISAVLSEREAEMRSRGASRFRLPPRQPTARFRAQHTPVAVLPRPPMHQPPPEPKCWRPSPALRALAQAAVDGLTDRASPAATSKGGLSPAATSRAGLSHTSKLSAASEEALLPAIQQRSRPTSVERQSTADRPATIEQLTASLRPLPTIERPRKKRSREQRPQRPAAAPLPAMPRSQRPAPATSMPWMVQMRRAVQLMETWRVQQDRKQGLAPSPPAQRPDAAEHRPRAPRRHVRQHTGDSPFRA